ncbi:MAG: cysteine desulfurase family protein [Parachlamydiaceae bacterium]
MKKKEIYLDNNATTFLDPFIKETLVSFLEGPHGNPSSTHAFGQESKSIINHYRRQVADYFNVRLSEIVFTSSGSESMSFLIRGCLENYRSGHIITSSLEHATVRKTLALYERKGFTVTYLPSSFRGDIEPDDLLKAITSDTRLITLIGANNETGVKNNITEVAQIAKQAGIPLVIDAVAWLGKDLLTIPDGVVGMGFSGHKIHALQGIGVAYVKSGSKLQPLINGFQEYGLRGGTENLLGIVSFGEAITKLGADAMVRMTCLRDYFEKELLEKIPEIKINGEGPRISNTSNIAFLGVDGESLLIALDQVGIAASHGSACSSGALEPSPVLIHMGIPLQQVRSSIRFSLSRFTTQEDINQAISVIVGLVQKLRQ